MQHAGLRIGRELQPAILFFDDHREEAVLFKISPQLRRQIGHLMGDLEVVRHAARFFNRAVDKGLLFCGQARLRVVVQLFPVRVTAKQIAFPPGGTCVDGLFFRARHRRHHFAETAKHRRGDKGFTHRREVQRQEDKRHRHQHPERPDARQPKGCGPCQQDHAAEQQINAVIEEHTEQNERCDNTQNHHNEKLPSCRRSDHL